jgi:uncharacterized membrane protein (UPF0127 family)
MVFINMKLKIKENIFKVKTLTDKKSQSIGMMQKKFDSSFDGLLFLMGGKKQCFWMMNCIIPLDIIMIKNNTVMNIHFDCPPCNEDPCPRYCGVGNIVLELEGGSCEKLGIEPGDWVEYIFD